MAFSFNYLARNSSSGNIDAGKAWIYNGTALNGSNETVATIVASGYFNAAQTTLVSPFPSGYSGTTGPLAVNDVIQVNGNDASGFYIVTSVTTNVTLASFETIGSIGTANILDGAVTTAKLAANAVTAAKMANNTVDYAQLAQDTFQIAIVSVPSASLLTLRATPYQLVAAPASGSVLQFLGAMVWLDYNSAAYTITSADNMAIRYTDGSGVIVSGSLTSTGLLDQTAVTQSDFYPLANAIVPFSASNAAPLMLHNTGAAEYTLGDSPLIVAVSNRILTPAL